MADRWNDRHPCRDPDVVERYALGRVTPPERAAIDEHCRDCAECRRLLQEELRLAAGVRRMARFRMKESLAERLSSTRRQDIPWPRIVAVAATIFIVAGVSVIGVWLQQRDNVQTAPPTVAAPPYEEEHNVNRGGTPVVPPTAKEQQLSDRTTAPPEKGSVLARKDIARSEKSEGAAAGETKSRTADAAREPERAAAAPPGTSARSGFGEGYWTEGIVSEEPAAAGAAHRVEMDNIRRPTPEMPTRAAQKTAAPSVALNQHVLLSQQPSRLLQGQEQQLQAKRKAVPTLVRQLDGQLSLTLYPDSLFPPQDLQRAIVRRSGDDSLLIQVGSQLIRYRLPSSLLQQVPAR